MDQAFLNEYLDCSAKDSAKGPVEGPAEDSSGSPPIANRLEVEHIMSLTFVDGPMLWNTSDDGKRRPVKELDANWLFFFAFARHCRLYSNIARDETPTIAVKL